MITFRFCSYFQLLLGLLDFFGRKKKMIVIARKAKINRVDLPGVDPGTPRMLSGYSTR